LDEELGANSVEYVVSVATPLYTTTTRNMFEKGIGKTQKNKTFAQLMGLINRKQIPVCQQCHENIHQGKYDGMKLSDLL
jgi:hypothetical protein